MRAPALPTGLLLLLLCSGGAIAQAPGSSQVAHPSQVAFVDEGPAGRVFREFPSALRLYTSDRDPPGRSVCNTGCSSKWFALRAPDDAVNMGEWTIVVRDSGVKQWAYRGKPVYTLIHDTPGGPAGDGDEGGVWHLVPHEPPAVAAAAPAR